MVNVTIYSSTMDPMGLGNAWCNRPCFSDAPEAPHLAPSPATESWDPSPDAWHSPAPAPTAAPTAARTSPWPEWPQWPTTAPRSTPRPTRAPPMVLITGPPDAMEWKPRCATQGGTWVKSEVPRGP